MLRNFSGLHQFCVFNYTGAYMKKQPALLIIIMLLAGAAAGCDNLGGKDIEVIDTGLVSVNGQEIILTENTDTGNSLWLVAGDRAGEAMGSLITRGSGGTQATINGAVYVTPHGDGFTVSLNAEGYPGTISFTDGTIMKLTNYTDTTVDVRLTPPDGPASATQTIALDKSFADLKALIEENGLIIDTAREATAADRMLRSIGLADYASEARTRKAVIKITSTALSVAGCVGALFISEVAPPVAVIACTSAYAGLVSTVEYITDVKVFAGDDVSGGVSFMLSTGACVGLSIPDCASALLSIADAAIADCKPAKEQFVKRCYSGNVYWFNDCGVRSEPEEECACGCENGACLPISSCTTPLAITVSALASPACATTGENIYFSSSVSGGDSSTYVYAWNFGDGGSSALDSDSHSYATAGRKTVSLTVSDSQGNYGFTAIPVQVEYCEDFLEADIGVSAGCVKKNEPVVFSAIVRGGVAGSYTYQWNFGDGGTSSEKYTSHSYSRDGLYLASLIVEDSLGKRAVDAVTIEVGNCPDDTGNSTTTTTTIAGPDLSPYTCCYLYVGIVDYCKAEIYSPDGYYPGGGEWGGGYNYRECPPLGYGSYDNGVFTSSSEEMVLGVKQRDDLAVNFSADGGLTIDTLRAKRTMTCVNKEEGCSGVHTESHEITASHIPCKEGRDSSTGKTYILCEIDGGDVASHIDSYSRKGDRYFGETEYTVDCSSAYNDYTLIHNEFFHDRTPFIRLYLRTADE